ncbi:MAG: DNA gyrase subunit A [Candidatus Hinthialibacteria bacterium OLB16]|nr:MAG: DNA gyrase subunit A [Candidatus Hinthialibacteria bacterium OLB16]
MIRQKVSEVRSIGRSTQGVRLIRLDDGDRVAAVTKIAEAANGDEDLPPAGETPPEPPLEQGQAEAEGLADGEGI